MSQKRTINLDVNTNAEQVGNQFDNLNKSVDETAKTTNKLHQKFEDVFKDSEPLTTVLGEMEDKLYELALAGKQSTDEFAELLAEVGKYRKTQIETDLAVDQAAGTMSQKLGGALQGAASGFALVQGAMGLFGTESEEVEQALLKVNSAMALADGIEGVQNFTKSFGLASKATKSFTVVQKALNLVLKGNPFALIVTAVIALIGYFATFTDAINVVIDGLKSVSDFLGITDSEAEEAAAKREQEAEVQRRLQEEEIKRQERLHNQKMTDLDNEIALARAQGKDTTTLQKKKIAEIIKIKKAKLEELTVDEAILENQRQQLIALSARGGAVGGAAEGMLKVLDERQAEAERLRNEISKLETDLKIVDIEFDNSKSRAVSSSTSSTSKDDPEKTAEENRKKQIKKEDEQFEMLQKLRNNAREQEIHELNKSYDKQFELAEGNAELEKELLKQQQLDVNAINKKFDDEAEAKRKEKEQKLKEQKAQELQLLNEATLKGKDLELANLELEFQEKFALAKNNAELMIALEEDLKNKKEKINKDYRDKDIEADAKRYNLQFQLANDSLGAISELVTVFAGKGEEAQKKAFKVNKAISIAQAVISTAQGITAQLAVPQDALTGANFVKAGIVAATGIAQVAKISATKFEGGSDTGGIDAPTDAGATATPTAQFNVVGDSGINQLAELQNQQPTKAFVVSSEVTTAQSLDRNRVQNATL